MRVLLLGATGRLGNEILETLLERNYRVNCLVRDSSKVKPNPNLSIFIGTPYKKEDLFKAIEGCDMVLSALNICYKGRTPFSKLRTPKDFFSKVSNSIVEFSNENSKIKKVIVCSAWGVNETNKDIPWWFRFIIKISNIKFVYIEHENQEQIISNSGLNFVFVRPSGLTNSKKNKKVIVSLHNTPKPKLTISRKNVAAKMVDFITDDTYNYQKPVLSANFF